MGMSYRGLISAGVLILGLLFRASAGAELEPREFNEEAKQPEENSYKGQFELD